MNIFQINVLRNNHPGNKPMLYSRYASSPGVKSRLFIFLELLIHLEKLVTHLKKFIMEFLFI